jgi:hypothetical protein
MFHAVIVAMALNHCLVFFAFVRNSYCHYSRMYDFFSRIESLLSACAFNDHELPPWSLIKITFWFLVNRPQHTPWITAWYPCKQGWKSVKPGSGITSDPNRPLRVRGHRFGSILPGLTFEDRIQFDQKNGRISFRLNLSRPTFEATRVDRSSARWVSLNLWISSGGTHSKCWHPQSLLVIIEMSQEQA